MMAEFRRCSFFSTTSSSLDFVPSVMHARCSGAGIGASILRRVLSQVHRRPARRLRSLLSCSPFGLLPQIPLRHPLFPVSNPPCANAMPTSHLRRCQCLAILISSELTPLSCVCALHPSSSGTALILISDIPAGGNFNVSAFKYVTARPNFWRKFRHVSIELIGLLMPRETRLGKPDIETRHRRLGS